jgi:hypothetical protein
MRRSNSSAQRHRRTFLIKLVFFSSVPILTGCYRLLIDVFGAGFPYRGGIAQASCPRFGPALARPGFIVTHAAKPCSVLYSMLVSMLSFAHGLLKLMGSIFRISLTIWSQFQGRDIERIPAGYAKYTVPSVAIQSIRTPASFGSPLTLPSYASSCPLHKAVLLNKQMF